MDTATKPLDLPFDDDIFILTLQLAEIEAQDSFRKGKWSETDPPDAIVALLDFTTELENAVQLVKDIKLVHSLAKAVNDDAAILQQLKNEEQQASRDRQIALYFEGNSAQNIDATSVIEATDIDDNSSCVSWSELNLKGGECSVDPDVQSICGSVISSFAPPSTSYALRQQQALALIPSHMLECVVCVNKFFPHRAIRLECTEGHIYCKDCLKHRFILSITDETLFPPKCCGFLIPITLVEDEFTPEEKKRYDDAAEEYSTTNRVYCSQSTCGYFISPTLVVNDRAICNRCYHQTCIHCKKNAHTGACLPDEDTLNFMAYAADQQWRQCFQCQAMVERLHGCNHMTCRCKAQFCYRCGVKWKRCSCGDWEADLLEQRAEEIVDREARHPLLARERVARVRAMEQRLQQNHECEHHGRWQKITEYRRRGYVCDFCGDRHHKYILGCRHCHVIACESCRRYRV